MNAKYRILMPLVILMFVSSFAMAQKATDKKDSPKRVGNFVSSGGDKTLHIISENSVKEKSNTMDSNSKRKHVYKKEAMSSKVPAKIYRKADVPDVDKRNKQRAQKKLARENPEELKMIKKESGN
ncbi:hypothetical protein LVD15_09140 [Fulvivirga maritima]|uniref:hypothetical protein n=1 Tax=Fulvivirga maritima TaxID=2904247 RepID=UPI001F2E5692|nr:hypothetical protein [Fulvivirga maritima]UII28579.1 hypothetical protein LVD15_09140 [Fulvivirga maritima]